MTTYRVADGHDVALVSLTVLSPQPAGGIVRPTRRNYLSDGSVVDEGLYVVFTWSSLQNTSAYSTILAAFGIGALQTNEVTIYAKDDTLSWKRYNGVAVRPTYSDGLDYRSFPRNIQVMIRNLEAL